jgi:hypothetical protein
VWRRTELARVPELEGNLPEEHFISYDSQGPNVQFVSIQILFLFLDFIQSFKIRT